MDGVGGEGHIKIDYVVTKWGGGVGKKSFPVAFSTVPGPRRTTAP